MAEIFPDEGLDAIMGIFPKNGATLRSFYIGLFTSNTAVTVPRVALPMSVQRVGQRPRHSLCPPIYCRSKLERPIYQWQWAQDYRRTGYHAYRGSGRVGHGKRVLHAPRLSTRLRALLSTLQISMMPRRLH